MELRGEFFPFAGEGMDSIHLDGLTHADIVKEYHAPIELRDVFTL